ncbi:MAG: hypothetical protein M3304_09810 [Actinomycetota bacterium]|nr:hypothetical protein [Actinomycetota bacterium]
MTLFTVQLELGPETRAMVERIATKITLHLELGAIEFGSKTRETIRSVAPLKRDGDESLLRKAADAARGK